MRAPAFIICMLPTFAMAEPREIAIVVLQNQEAVLFDDGTWQFRNPDVVLADPSELTCIESTDKRVAFCPSPDDWKNPLVYVQDGFEELTLTSADGAFQLSSSLDKSYGHGADLSLYEDGGTHNAGIFERLALRALGVSGFDEMTMVHNDAGILVSDYSETEPFYASLSAEVVLFDQSLYVDITSIPVITGYNDAELGDIDMDAAKTTIINTLQNSITLDGVTLFEIVQGQTE